jgi:hypothetical protein
MRPCLPLAVCAALLLSVRAEARPPHKQALADHFGPFLNKKLHDCRTCHVPEAPGPNDSLGENKPHNPFGRRLAAVRGELRKAGKKVTIPARLDAIADEDSDGDGASNLLELLSGHAPGDQADAPTPAEITAARQRLNDLARFRSAYPWRPFEVVSRPPVPAVKNAGWVRNPIDSFLVPRRGPRGARPHAATGGPAPRPPAPRVP